MKNKKQTKEQPTPEETLKALNEAYNARKQKITFSQIYRFFGSLIGLLTVLGIMAGVLLTVLWWVKVMINVLF